MFGDLDWPLSASRGLSAIAEFLINKKLEFDLVTFHLAFSLPYLNDISYNLMASVMGDIWHLGVVGPTDVSAMN